VALTCHDATASCEERVQEHAQDDGDQPSVLHPSRHALLPHEKALLGEAPTPDSPFSPAQLGELFLFEPLASRRMHAS